MLFATATINATSANTAITGTSATAVSDAAAAPTTVAGRVAKKIVTANTIGVAATNSNGYQTGRSKNQRKAATGPIVTAFQMPGNSTESTAQALAERLVLHGHVA